MFFAEQQIQLIFVAVAADGPEPWKHGRGVPAQSRLGVRNALAGGQGEQQPGGGIAQPAPGRNLPGKAPAAQHHGGLPPGEVPVLLQTLCHAEDVCRGVLAVAVRAHHGPAREVVGDEAESCLEGKALSPVFPVADHMAPKGFDAVEHIPVGRAAAVIHHHDGYCGRSGAD